MDLDALYRMNALLADNVWRPGFGARWLWWISLAHLLAFWLCLAAEKKERSLSTGYTDSKRPNFWFVLALFMLALCLNKIFDLQSLLTVFLRNTAKLDGWYAQRRSIQAVFIVAVAVVGLILMIVSAYLLRNHWRQRGLALMAALFLLTLFVIRTASYHPVDDILYHLPVIKNRMNAGLELGGALLVGLGALLASRRKPDSTQQPA